MRRHGERDAGGPRSRPGSADVDDPGPRRRHGPWVGGGAQQGHHYPGRWGCGRPRGVPVGQDHDGMGPGPESNGGADGDPQIRSTAPGDGVVELPTLSLWVVVSAANKCRRSRRRAELDPVTLSRLGGDSSPLVRRAVAGHGRTPPDVLRRTVRCQLAAHPGTRPDRLGEVAADDSWRVRMAVASNPAAPLGLLRSAGCWGSEGRYMRVAGWVGGSVEPKPGATTTHVEGSKVDTRQDGDLAVKERGRRRCCGDYW